MQFLFLYHTVKKTFSSNRPLLSLLFPVFSLMIAKEEDDDDDDENNNNNKKTKSYFFQIFTQIDHHLTESGCFLFTTKTLSLFWGGRDVCGGLLKAK